MMGSSEGSRERGEPNGLSADSSSIVLVDLERERSTGPPPEDGFGYTLDMASARLLPAGHADGDAATDADAEAEGDDEVTGKAATSEWLLSPGIMPVLAGT